MERFVFNPADITVTTTATHRLELLSRTYQSLAECLLNRGLHLRNFDAVINVDPVPASGSPISHMNKFLMFAFDHADVHFADTPNFTRAVKYCWMDVGTRFVLHIEDDWEFSGNIDLEEMASRLVKTNAYQIRFNRGGAFVRRKLGLSPALWFSSDCRDIARQLDESVNPEVQLGSLIKPGGRPIAMRSGKEIIARDIGRTWAQENGILRPALKTSFTKWVGT